MLGAQSRNTQIPTLYRNFITRSRGSEIDSLRTHHLALEDKFDDIKKLIDTGKEKGYLTYDQVNDLIPQDVHQS